MSAGILAAEANALLASILTGTLYAQIHTTAGAGAAGTSNISAGSTARAAITFGTPSGGAASQTGSAPLWTNGGSTEVLGFVTLWTASSGGTCEWVIALSASQSWGSGNTFTLVSTSLSIGPVAS